jgi:hypothetical protein
MFAITEMAHTQFDIVGEYKNKPQIGLEVDFAIYSVMLCNTTTVCYTGLEKFMFYRRWRNESKVSFILAEPN